MQLFIRRHHADLVAGAVFLAAAVAVLWRPILRGEVFLPLDLVAHMPPWRYSYERTAVANAFPSDLVLEYFPRRLIATQMLRDGHLPLWNPFVLGGMPLLADGYSALLYPLSVLFLLLPVGPAFGWFALVHLALAGLGSYWLARTLGLRPVSATLAGVGYMGNGFLMAWLLFPEFSAVSAWLPVALACVERYEQHAVGERGLNMYRKRHWAYAIAAGVVLALCVLCQLQLAFYVGGAVAIYWLARRALTKPSKLGGALGMLLAVAGLSLLLSAAQWLPTIELARDSQRVGSVGRVASGLNLLRFVIPAAFGGPRPGVALGEPQAIPVYPYAGLLPLLLALIGAWHARNSQRATLLLLALTTLGLTATPAEVLRQIPLLNQLPGTDRWTMVLALALALLAGFGLEELLGVGPAAAELETSVRSSPRLLWLSRGLVAAALLALGAALLWHLQLFTPRSRYGEYLSLLYQGLRLFPLLVALASLLLALLLLVLRVVGALQSRYVRTILGAAAVLLVALDLGWYGLPVQSSADPERLFQPTADLLAALGPAAVHNNLSGDMVYPPTRTSHFLAQDRELYRVLAADYPSFQPNLPSAFGIQDPRGYASLFSRQYLQFARAWEGKLSDDPGWVRVYLAEAYKARRLLDLMGVRYVLFNPQSPNEQHYPNLELVQRGDEGAIYLNPTALPRAFLVHTAETFPDATALLTRLTAAEFPVGQTVLLSEPAPPLQPAAAGAHESTTVTSYTPNHVTIAVQASAPAMLVMSDTLYPGWEATVDGRPTKVYAADLVLRGVAVPAGEHQVEFRYRPRSLVIGACLSFLGLTLVAIMLGLLWRGSNRPVTS